MKTTAALTILVLGLVAPVAKADAFGSEENTFEIEFVNIGNPGNPVDTTGSPNPAGSVDYVYRMGQFEISRDMVTKANNVGGLGVTLESTFIPSGGLRPSLPATGVTWFEAAKFVNWLNTSEGHAPAYKFDNDSNFQLWTPNDHGYNADNLYRNGLAYYFLPSFDERYKAAYYDPISEVYYNYPTGSDTQPSPVASGTEPNTAVYGGADYFPGPADIMLAGGLSPYGTRGLGGNVSEWGEVGPSPSIRLIHGGDWALPAQSFSSFNTGGLALAAASSIHLGFRVASIPEPSTMLLTGLAAAGLLLRRRRG